MGKRVLQISLDILVGKSIDGEDLAQAIRTELEEHGLGLTILGAGFQCDLTEEYASHPQVRENDHIKLKLSGSMVEIPIEPKECEDPVWK
jgi:hypothetical protein